MELEALWGVLLGGLVGSLVGAGAAFWIARSQVRDDRVGALRSAYLEMREIDSRLRHMGRSNLRVPISITTWPQVRDRVALALSAGDFWVVGQAMLSVQVLVDS